MSQEVRRPTEMPLSRRTVVAGSMAGAIGLGLGIDRIAAQTPAATVAATAEAPLLAEMVAAGTIPPLAERVPPRPAVVAPLNEIGTYGGTIRRAQTTPTDAAFTFLNRASLLEWSLDQTYTPVLALAEAFEVSDDVTTYTITIREGVKWSDGEPFTTADIMFWYEDLVMNAEYSPGGSALLKVKGEQATIAAVDDLTFTVTFPQPNALFPRVLAFNGFGILVPKHYLSQFHPTYADPAALEAAIAEAGVTSWTELMTARNGIMSNADRPVLGAWRVVEAISSGATRLRCQRNPYYWKVDTAGNQLPYVDEMVFDVLDAAALVLRAANGEIDLQLRYLGFKDMPVLQGGAEAGGYTVLQWQTDAPWTAMYVNQSHLDPGMRALFQNVDFRAGLSQAINREEMNQLLYLGLGDTYHPCAVPQDPYFVEGYGRRFTEYNVDEANAALDRAGVTARDGDGYRVRPDGTQLAINILSYPAETGSNTTDSYELVRGYWEAVGIRTSVEEIDRTLWTERMKNSEFDISGYTVAGLLWDVDPLWYIPTADTCYWAPLFGLYYATAGAEGEAPPEPISGLVTLYGDMQSAATDEERLAAGQEILRIHDENVFMIGTVTLPFQPFVVSNRLGNVMQDAVASYRSQLEQFTQFEQVYYRS